MVAVIAVAVILIMISGVIILMFLITLPAAMILGSQRRNLSHTSRCVAEARCCGDSTWQEDGLVNLSRAGSSPFESPASLNHTVDDRNPA